jgi:hypothetical protein
MPNTPALPPGFTLDSQQAPPLPPGFTVDQPAQQPPSNDPRIQLQDLLIEQGKGTPGLEQQIAQLRQSTGEVSDPAMSERQLPGLGSDIVSGLKTAANVGTGLAGTIAGGIAGTVASPLGFIPGMEGTGDDVLKAVQGFANKFQLGQDDPRVREFTQNIDVASKGVNIPAGGLTGLLELATGQGVDAAVDVSRNVAKKGFSKVLGDSVMEETGSELLSTLAETTPALLGSILGMKKINPTKTPGKDFSFQTPAKKRIGELLKEGSSDVSTAGFQLKDSIITGAKKVVKSKVGKEALKQGLDPAIVAGVGGANSATKRAMRAQTRIQQARKADPVANQAIRPTDTVGKGVMERFQVVRAANRKAGADIGKVVDKLEGKVDQTVAKQGFIDDLAELDVSFNGTKPVFNNSAIRGLNAPKKIINEVSKAINRTDLSIPKESHKLKGFLDEQLKAGKSAKGGLTGKTIRVIENLRRNVDDALDSTFPAYNKVNKNFRETKLEIDKLQDIVGKKIDLMDPSTNKIAGAKLRGVMSNNQSRVPIINMMDSLQRVATKHAKKGVKFDDNLMLQTMYAETLERLFKDVKQTSLKGQVPIQTPPTTLAGLAVEGGKKVVEKVRNINEEAAFKSIQRLLKDEK